MSMEYGCLFCVTGHERNVMNYLLDQGIKAISPIKIRLRRRKGAMELENVLLFPGYVFFAIDDVDSQGIITVRSEQKKEYEFYQQIQENQDLHIIKSHSDVIKVLRSGENGKWELAGADKEFVQQLFSIDGEIGLSKAYYVGKKIHIQSGFLKKYESSITAVNRRAKTAHVTVTINDREFSLWLGFEEIADGCI